MKDRARLRSGLLFALAASGVSGLAVFLNSYAVKHVHASPTTYTTAKNLVAALLLLAVMAPRRRVGSIPTPSRPKPTTWISLGYIGVIGGGLAFALFFQGLAQTSATTAAFAQKSLVIWVIAMAVPVLGERVGPAQLVAVALLVLGALVLGASHGGFRSGQGTALVLAATVLWAGEVIVAKRLLLSITPWTLGLVRMGAGTITLLAWLAATGRVAQLGHLGAEGWEWVLLTGVVLAGYVALWLNALARAQAVEVTAVLVSAAFITAALSAGVQGATLPHAWGLILVAAGIIVIAAAWSPSKRAPLPKASP